MNRRDLLNTSLHKREVVWRHSYSTFLIGANEVSPSWVWDKRRFAMLSRSRD